MKTKYGNVDFPSRNEHNEGLIIGLLIGAAIGAIGAILLAPTSGKDVRKKVKNLVGKQAENLDDQWENAKDKAGNVVDNAKDAVESAGSKAESKLNQFADKAENEVSDGAEKVIDKFQKRY